MLGTIVVLLVLMWLLGMISPNTIGSFLPILLVLAVVVVILRLVSGRRAV
jgi:hypothetical protein